MVVIGNMSATYHSQQVKWWAIHNGTRNQQVIQNTNPTHNLHTAELYHARGKQHPFPLTMNYLLQEYEDLFRGIGCFTGPPYHIKIDQEVSPVDPSYVEELKR